VEDVDEPRLTVSAAARRLGIAPATLRTWDRRYGIGPTDHAPGHHRRYSPDDMARLEVMQHALVRGASPAEAARYALSVPVAAGSGVDGDGRVMSGEPPYGQATVVKADGTRVDDPPVVDAERTAEPGVRVRVGGRVLRLPGAGRRARGLGRAALSMDPAAVRRLLGESLAADGVVATWDAVALPVLVAVGERWAETGQGVEVEHLLAETVAAVFAAHAEAAAPPRTVRPVLLAGMPGELHDVPLAVLAAALAEAGVGYRLLGPNLPLEGLVAAVRRTAPVVVVLWSQLPSTADGAVVAALPRTRPRFRAYVAGPGWVEEPLPPRVDHLGSLGAAVDELVAVALS
jgi:MerR family transcriptional regulator, light-induced transcriptional regulator